MTLGLLIILTIAGCNGGGIIPDDDGNGNTNGDGFPGEDISVVLIEAFIAEDCGYCRVIEPILERLASEYGRDKMILLELAPWGLHSITEVNDRFKWYLPNISDRGTPNVLFNGLQDRIYQQTQLYNYNVIKGKIENQLSLAPTILLTASRTADSTGTVITGKVKNIGNSTLTDLVVNGMTIKNRGRTGFRYSVADIFEDEKFSIKSLASGEEVYFNIRIEGLIWDANLDGVVFVQSIASSKKNIRQSVFLD